MRSSGLVFGIVVIATTAAWAQPGGAPTQPYAPQPYAPQPYAPQPYPQPPAPGYMPPVQLTAEENELLKRGEISEGEHIGGGLAALFIGFGSGQAIQGRWGDRGWIFTLGEVASIGLLLWGWSEAWNCTLDDIECDDSRGVGKLTVGALAFSGFRVWETIDAFAVPAGHNRDVRALRMRLGYPPAGYGRPGYSLHLAPSQGNGRGGVAGLTVRF